MFRRHGKTIVASVAVLVGIIVGVMLINYAKAEPTDTYHSSWHVVRAAAAEDGATFAAVYDLAAGEGDFASKDTSTVAAGGPFKIISHSANIAHRGEGYSPGGAWMFTIGGVGLENDVFSFNLVGWAKTNGMAQIICEGNGVLGTQDIVIYPGGSAVTDGLWADTITLDETTKWPSVAVYNSSDDEVANMVVDTTGLEWVQFVVYDALGAQAGEANSVAVYGRRY